MELTKHHGLGNDFLVLILTPESGGAAAVPDAALARAVCDRHRGVGADGLLVLSAAAADVTADVTMVLLNADGSRAEMSGNGVACLAQAAFLTGLAAGPTVTVATDAGLRLVRLSPGSDVRTLRATVDMGNVAVTDAPAWASDDVTRAARVDVGNPHLVLQLADASRIDDREWLVELGAKANAEIDGGINVEVVAPATRGSGIRMDVYERGVGLTDACGTGAVAAAAAAHRWGLAGADPVEVAMHGGTVTVGLDAESAGGPAGRSTLTTAVTYVAAVEYPWP